MEIIAKETAVEIAIKVVEDFFSTTCFEESNNVANKMVHIYEPSVQEKGYYEHKGWIIDVKEKVEKGDSFLVSLLSNGLVLNVVPFSYDNLGQPKMFYIIKYEDGRYGEVSYDRYFEYHNFTFEEDQFTYKKW